VLEQKRPPTRETEPPAAAGPRPRRAMRALGRLPLHALSRAAGRFAALRLPAPLQRAEIRAFAAAAGVDWSEVRDPLPAFPSLQAFFTRALRDGVRPVDPAPDAVVAPCDGAWGASGTVQQGLLLQVKGQTYSLEALLGDPSEARAYEGGAFATFYLAPRDYHRFHMPCAAQPRVARHVPGRLWPVNRLGVEGVPGLFAANERICVRFALASGACFSIVAVGATLVGSVRIAFDPSLGTGARHAAGERRYERITLAKGEEWGRFEFGSTLVLVAAPDALSIGAPDPGTPLRLGTRIGTLRVRGADARRG
jgi:phosphatidylserine decarboxylase